jgi:hypothetical protein
MPYQIAQPSQTLALSQQYQNLNMQIARLRAQEQQAHDQMLFKGMQSMNQGLARGIEMGNRRAMQTEQLQFRQQELNQRLMAPANQMAMELGFPDYETMLGEYQQGAGSVWQSFPEFVASLEIPAQQARDKYAMQQAKDWIVQKYQLGEQMAQDQMHMQQAASLGLDMPTYQAVLMGMQQELSAEQQKQLREGLLTQEQEIEPFLSGADKTALKQVNEAIGELAVPSTYRRFTPMQRELAMMELDDQKSQILMRGMQRRPQTPAWQQEIQRSGYFTTPFGMFYHDGKALKFASGDFENPTYALRQIMRMPDSPVRQRLIENAKAKLNTEKELLWETRTRTDPNGRTFQWDEEKKRWDLLADAPDSADQSAATQTYDQINAVHQQLIKDWQAQVKATIDASDGTGKVKTPPMPDWDTAVETYQNRLKLLQPEDSVDSPPPSDDRPLSTLPPEVQQEIIDLDARMRGLVDAMKSASPAEVSRLQAEMNQVIARYDEITKGVRYTGTGGEG